MPLANLALTNTFDEWRIRTNQLVTEVNDINANTLATFVSNNAGLVITSSPIRKGNIYFQLNVTTTTSDTASINLASALSVNLVSNVASYASANANAAYNKANSANILAFQVGGAVTTANALITLSYDKANAANFLAFTANVTANYANVLAKTAYELASTAVSNNTPALGLATAQSAYAFANTVNAVAYAAIHTANDALPNGTVTLAGSLLSTGYINTTSSFYSAGYGTAIKPSYSWTGDDNTGMYRVSANVLGFTTGGAARVTVDTSGYVGIGTTAPAKLLEISGGSSEVFVGTGSISGNVLTISSVISGQINVGHYITDEALNVLGGTFVKEYFGGTGGLGTYNLTASQATVSSTTIYAFNMHNNTFRITGTDTTVNPGQPLGMIEFASNDADLTTDERSRAFIYAVNEQANAGATLIFGTSVGSRESTERLRINRLGALGIGGKNFGTAGQILRTTGESGAPQWVNDAAFDKANSANSLAFNVSLAANSFASATIAGANSAVGAGANAFTTAATAGANAYMIAVQAGSNTAIGAGANTYLLATISGANTAVGTGANAFASATISGANTYLLTTIAAANTAVGAGANAYTTAAAAGANAYATAAAAGANTYQIAIHNGSNTAVGTGANTVGIAAFAKANTIGTLGTQGSGSVSISGGSITGLTTLGTSAGTVGTNAYRAVTINTGTTPSGATGDIWLVYV